MINVAPARCRRLGPYSINAAPTRYVPRAREGCDETLERRGRGILRTRDSLRRKLAPAMAGRRVTAVVDELRPCSAANIDCMGATGVKMTAGRRRQRARHVALEDSPLAAALR